MRTTVAYILLLLLFGYSQNSIAQYKCYFCTPEELSMLTPYDVFAKRALNDEKRNIVLNDVSKHNTALETASLACDSLQTTLAGTNGHDGIMFNITALKWVTITQFAANINPVNSGYVKIYYKQWTWQDSTTNPAAWTFIDSAMVTSAGYGEATVIPVNVNVTIPAGNTAAFYITGTGSLRLVYSNGTLEDAVQAGDTSLQVKQGIGIAYPFGSIYTPRIFNGQVFYCDAPVGVNEESTSEADVTIAPNPFSESTVISFGKQLSDVSLAVYDVLGKEVKHLNAGSTDKAEVSREGLESGVYFVQVIAEGKPVAVKRMIIE
jgi:hypothetical protein